LLKGYSLVAKNGVSDTAALILERWQCVRRIRTLLGNLRHQRSTLRGPTALRPCGEEFKPFFVRYRSSLDRADATCSSYMTVTTLFYRGCARIRYFPFSPNSYPSGYSRNDTNGSNHIPTISAAMLRSYTGLGCSTCATPCETVCNRPTVFTERPLLTGALAHYEHLAFARHTLRTLSHASVTSFRARLGFFAGFAQISIHHPIHLHAGVRLRFLTLACYSCRHRSPVSSEARSAIPDSSSRPLSCNRALPACNVLLGFPSKFRLD